MNSQLIEKIITSNNLQCPKLIYENPVLDRNVAKALSKSFVKILNLSHQSSKVNSNLRLNILENIRKMCQTEPENHIKIDENITAVLLEFYEKNYKDSRMKRYSIDKDLDGFLIRNLKDMNLKSNQNSQLDPEIVQALINLNRDGVYLDSVLRDIIYWNSNEKNNSILRDLWTYDNDTSKNNEDISIKLKPEIEKCLLNICYNILNETDPNIENMFYSDTYLKKLIKISSNSANCFQICCGILNYLFIMTNFDTKIQTLVQMFVNHVKESCSSISFSVLYPLHLSHIVVLLDIELKELPTLLQMDYVISAKEYLTELKSKSENDLIMLLSHFPHWFHV